MVRILDFHSNDDGFKSCYPLQAIKFMFDSIISRMTSPTDAFKKGSFEPHPDDLVTQPYTQSDGSTVHALPKDCNQEVEELKNLFNTASHEAQTIFIQKIVRSYSDEVKEFLKEVN